jgi:hypothetical protein
MNQNCLSPLLCPLSIAIEAQTTMSMSLLASRALFGPLLPFQKWRKLFLVSCSCFLLLLLASCSLCLCLCQTPFAFASGFLMIMIFYNTIMAAIMAL